MCMVGDLTDLTDYTGRKAEREREREVKAKKEVVRWGIGALVA